MYPFSTTLSERLVDALSALAPEGLPDGFTPAVTAANDTRFGDYQSNAAMVLQKHFGSNPREIAAKIVEKIDVADLSETPTIAGPGFINFRIRPDAVAAKLASLLSDDRLGVPSAPEPKRIIIDYSSPNIAKPMHIGHVRSTVIGDALARIGRFLGHEVIGDNHIGDWGTPIGQVLYGWKNHLDQAAFDKDPVAELLRLYQLVKKSFESDKEIESACLEETVKLQSGDADNLALWKQFCDITAADRNATYARLDIKHDTELGESFFHEQLAPLVETLLADGIAEESDGAICVFSNGKLEPKNDPLLISRDGEWQPVPCLIRKKDGGFNYATTDLATIDHRVDEQKADQVLYVVDDRQSLHFRQVFEVAAQRGIHADLKHIAFGKILGKDKKPYKTREGTVPSLGDVLDDAVSRARTVVDEKSAALPDDERAEIAERIGIGSVKYAELSQNRANDYIFDWDKMLALDGNTAPYLLFAYVRLRAIFRKLGDETPDLSGELAITEDAERTLAMKLAQYGETVPSLLSDHRPNLLANYLYDLAQNTHSFIAACHVLSSEGTARTTRLTLCELTSRVLKHGLGLLGIKVAERM